MCIRDRPRLPHSWVYTPFRSGIPFRHRLRLPSRCVCPFCLKIQDKLRHTGAEKSLDGRPLQGLSEVHGVGLCIGVSKPGKCLADDDRFDECRAEALDGIVRNDAKWCRLEHCVETVSYTHLRAHETRHDLVCRLLLEKKKNKKNKKRQIKK